MPATEPVPTLAELLAAHGDGIRGLVDPTADTRRGAVYDHWAGAGALLFTREASRDRDLFRACYFDTAEGAKLNEIARRRFGVEPIVATFGEGSAALSRDTLTAGEGTVFAGTRISVIRPNSEPVTFAVKADTIASTSMHDVVVPIRPLRRGAGAALRTAAAPGVVLRIDDPLWDATWRVMSLECANGTDAESPSALRARARQARLDRRKGYAKAITDACVSEGAAHVALFASSYAGDENDHGLNWCYVGDIGYSGSDALVRRCHIALERFRVLGADLQVRPMTPAPITVRAMARLWDDPGGFNTRELEDAIAATLIGYFDRRLSAFGYSLDAMAGAALSALDPLQSLDFTQPVSSAGVTTTVAGAVQFPATLRRYTLNARDVAVAFLGPA
jgi:hypothetical protein